MLAANRAQNNFLGVQQKKCAQKVFITDCILSTPLDLKMDFKLVVLVLTLIAANHAYVVIDTYADLNCNTTLIARFIVSNANRMHPKK
jgi:hypothetical protein